MKGKIVGANYQSMVTGRENGGIFWQRMYQ